MANQIIILQLLCTFKRKKYNINNVKEEINYFLQQEEQTEIKKTQTNKNHQVLAQFWTYPNIPLWRKNFETFASLNMLPKFMVMISPTQSLFLVKHGHLW